VIDGCRVIADAIRTQQFKLHLSDLPS
jgi:hypothetical protein